MSLKIRFETGQEDRWSETFEFPGSDAAQLTYEELRATRGGDTLAYLNRGWWTVADLEQAKQAGLPASQEKAWDEARGWSAGRVGASPLLRWSDVIVWTE